ncbi:MAG: hypothetical protein AVDCRST_MAG57-3603, partial [uncultured Blastococcus sp.]
AQEPGAANRPPARGRRSCVRRLQHPPLVERTRGRLVLHLGCRRDGRTRPRRPPVRRRPAQVHRRRRPGDLDGVRRRGRPDHGRPPLRARARVRVRVERLRRARNVVGLRARAHRGQRPGSPGDRVDHRPHMGADAPPAGAVRGRPPGPVDQRASAQRPLARADHTGHPPAHDRRRRPRPATPGPGGADPGAAGVHQDHTGSHRGVVAGRPAPSQGAQRSRRRPRGPRAGATPPRRLERPADIRGDPAPRAADDHHGMGEPESGRLAGRLLGIRASRLVPDAHHPDLDQRREHGLAPAGRRGGRPPCDAPAAHRARCRAVRDGRPPDREPPVHPVVLDALLPVAPRACGRPAAGGSPERSALAVPGGDRPRRAQHATTRARRLDAGLDTRRHPASTPAHRGAGARGVVRPAPTRVARGASTAPHGAPSQPGWSRRRSAPAPASPGAQCAGGRLRPGGPRSRRTGRPPRMAGHRSCPTDDRRRRRRAGAIPEL